MEYEQLIRDLMSLPPQSRQAVITAADQKRRALGSFGMNPGGIDPAPVQKTNDVVENLRPVPMATKPTSVAGPEAMQKMRSQGAKMGAALQDILRG
jgi:hypothetical protein